MLALKVGLTNGTLIDRSADSVSPLNPGCRAHRNVDDGVQSGINLRNRKSVVDNPSSDPYLWYASANRRIERFLGSHPRGLLLADFPNNFRKVFRLSGCAPPGRWCQQCSPQASKGDCVAGLVEDYCEVMRR